MQIQKINKKTQHLESKTLTDFKTEKSLFNWKKLVYLYLKNTVIISF
jgi:hypothetical protein